MKTVIALVLAVCVAFPNFSTADEPKPPTAARLNAEPEKYEGKSLEFDKVQLYGDLLKKDKDKKRFDVAIAAGNTLYAGWPVSDIKFVTPEKVGGQLLDFVEGAKYEVKIKFKVVKNPDEKSRDKWLCEITEIDFYGVKGNVVKTVK